MDGMEITQFTYFQQAGGIELDPVSVELTYGLERIGMHLQKVRGHTTCEWSPDVSWADVYLDNERQFSAYNYELADTDMLARHFDDHEAEAGRCLEAGLPLAAYDQVLKCSHAFNLLDSGGRSPSPTGRPTSCACGGARRCGRTGRAGGRGRCLTC